MRTLGLSRSEHGSLETAPVAGQVPRSSGDDVLPRCRMLARWTVALVMVIAADPARAQQTPPSSPPPTAQKETGDKWQPLFDGKSLAGWKVTDFGGQGDVTVQDGAIVLGMGSMLTGITYDREFPRCDYEVRWEAQRVDGVDFFSTLTFPVGDAYCSLVVGGWGGAVVGISCLDYADASQNQTTRYVKFNKGQWYRFRLQVRRDRLQAWIDDEPVVDVEIRDRKLTTRIEVKRSEPLGFATWETRGALRKIEFRPLEPDL